MNASQLLDVVVRHELLQNVIQSITRNGLALLVTAFLGVILIYLFSVAGFLFFQPHFEPASCTSLFTCTITAVYRGCVGAGLNLRSRLPPSSRCQVNTVSRPRGDAGVRLATRRLRSGGGIGDVLEPVSFGEAGLTARFVYDTTFYYLIIVLLMNLLFGIIIDTFADLRTEKAGAAAHPRGWMGSVATFPNGRWAVGAARDGGLLFRSASTRRQHGQHLLHLRARSIQL